MCVFGLNCFSFIIEKKIFVKKLKMLLINKTTFNKLASKKECQDAFLKFKCKLACARYACAKIKSSKLTLLKI